MLQLRQNEAGFTMIEALVALAISAALMALVIDLLTKDSLQTRRFVSRSERTVQQIQALHSFRTAAALAEGAGTVQQAGSLRIIQNRLVVESADSVQTLFEWTTGTGALAYSGDGQTWRSNSDNVGEDAIRFQWRHGASTRIWLAP